MAQTWTPEAIIALLTLFATILLAPVGWLIQSWQARGTSVPLSTFEMAPLNRPAPPPSSPPTTTGTDLDEHAARARPGGDHHGAPQDSSNGIPTSSPAGANRMDDSSLSDRVSLAGVTASRGRSASAHDGKEPDSRPHSYDLDIRREDEAQQPARSVSSHWGAPVLPPRRCDRAIQSSRAGPIVEVDHSTSAGPEIACGRDGSNTIASLSSSEVVSPT
ncbi:hypothetical protein BDZ85DRAFT_24971 [Elsinoe ampelina]|uniref:Uncharacterized protein n=1 Tax=Elsinoe ampelina TaxID=302913 RepID=A0A6A6G6E2_9PEZI|nr:hypothetical protein BDZ85DRAFT_24971 [Elsinoe ampelina]